MSRLSVIPLPALADNYMYLLRDARKGTCAIVDPSQAAPLVQELQARPALLTAILLTHHHRDHVGGLEEVLARMGPVPVYGALQDRDRIPGINRALCDGDELELAGERVQALLVPGHTRGHLAYHLPGSGHLFCGDVLFGSGCGRLFEGTPAQMYRSLQRLAALPASTRIWCGHEYTRDNLRFALSLEPRNPNLSDRLRRASPPTIPLDLSLEKRTNPFLRCHDPALQEATGLSDPLEVFAALRRLKDQFR
jgi:hydroxyacylglutathione hydrolase